MDPQADKLMRYDHLALAIQSVIETEAAELGLSKAAVARYCETTVFYDHVIDMVDAHLRVLKKDCRARRRDKHGDPKDKLE